MTVMVRVAREPDIKSILERDQPLHRMDRRGIHPDAAVPINSHERKGRIDVIADDRQIDSIALGDSRPVVHAGAAERIDTEADSRAADHAKIDHAAEIGDIGAEEIVLVRGGCAARTRKRHPPHAREAIFEHRVRPRLDPAGDIGVRGAAVGGVVLEPAVVGRVV